MASQRERGTLPSGGCFGAEGLLGWSCCWGTRSEPSGAELSACAGTTGTVPEGRILSLVSACAGAVGHILARTAPLGAPGAARASPALGIRSCPGAKRRELPDSRGGRCVVAAAAVLLSTSPVETFLPRLLFLAAACD